VSVSISFANGRQLAFDVREGAGPPCFLLSVRKCGSSITNNICHAVAKANDRCFVDVGDRLFANNFTVDEWQRDPALAAIVRPGVVYGGFRDAPLALFDDPLFASSPKFFMIRDPRDALVSLYFSTAYSHPVPQPIGAYEEMTKRILETRQVALTSGVGPFVIAKARALGRSFEAYAPVLSMPNLIVAKYEDYILRKPALIDLMARHFRLQASDRTVNDILKWADVLPVEEDTRSFVRQVLPGDHLRKLDAPTIGKLNTILAGAMKLFGYSI